MLTKHLDHETVTPHFSKRLSSYATSKQSRGAIQLLFEDGSTFSTDVLIGCDGIRSATRHTLLELAAAETEISDHEGCFARAAKLRNAVEETWTGCIAYRGVVPREEVEASGCTVRALDRPVMV